MNEILNLGLHLFHYFLIKNYQLKNITLKQYKLFYVQNGWKNPLFSVTKLAHFFMGWLKKSSYFIKYFKQIQRKLLCEYLKLYVNA